jgi:two-component system cell cycle response regulator DivK
MRKKILIVEDDAIIRDALMEFLANEGYETSTATNGKEAVDIAQQFSPDLIIMDMFMPVMDGWDATRIIKETENLVNTKVVCLSAYTSAENEAKSKQVKCDLILTKPIYPDDLKRNLEELLK